jgi:signal peptidase I
MPETFKEMKEIKMIDFATFTKALSLSKGKNLTLLLTLFFFATIIGIKTYIIDRYTIVSPSMLPLLNVGDKIWINKSVKALKINDIAAFYAPNGETTPYIKRCIASPLDTLIRLEDGSLTLKNNLQNRENQYFIIPKKGFAVKITLQNLTFYKPLIEQQEGGQIGVVGNQLYINGAIQDTYTFQQNYYFMVGDNRENSHDSRYWGLVGEKSVVGKW